MNTWDLSYFSYDTQRKDNYKIIFNGGNNFIDSNAHFYLLRKIFSLTF